MTQEIEIEFKNLLSHYEYSQLMKALHFKVADVRKQVNYYFETSNFHLKKRQAALRIRKKSDEYIFTLKQPHEQGLLETHAPISHEQFIACQKGDIQLPEEIENQLLDLAIPVKDLEFKGELTTYRVEKQWMDCIVVLDRSVYHDTEDYELEVEAPNFQLGETCFKQILRNHHIIERKTKNKVARFFDQLSKK
jgi:uncharacterized protein YjbK